MWSLNVGMMSSFVDPPVFICLVSSNDRMPSIMASEGWKLAQLYLSINTTLFNRKKYTGSYDVFLNFILGPMTFFSD